MNLRARSRARANCNFPSFRKLSSSKGIPAMTNNRASKSDGQLFRVESADIVPGAVLRMLNQDGTASPFSDCVVVAVYPVDKMGKRVHSHEPARTCVGRVAEMSRPYLYVAHSDTVCPTVLTGHENFTVDTKTLTKEDSQFRVVVRSTGSVSTFTT
jgi:hypothetical protein